MKKETIRLIDLITVEEALKGWNDRTCGEASLDEAKALARSIYCEGVPLPRWALAIGLLVHRLEFEIHTAKNALARVKELEEKIDDQNEEDDRNHQ